LEHVERLKAHLAQLHGAPPCIYAIDIATVQSWTETQREQQHAALRASLDEATALLQHAQQERTALWERSDAPESDRALPPITLFQSIQEDLESYEDILKFVRSKNAGTDTGTV
jgi:hypothetical protein